MALPNDSTSFGMIKLPSTLNNLVQIPKVDQRSNRDGQIHYNELNKYSNINK